MGCRLSGPWIGGETQVNAHPLSHLSKHDALRILAAYEHPITMQIKGHRGSGLHQDCSTQTERAWEPLPLSLHNLNLPQRTTRMCVSASETMPRVNPAYQDRHYCSHLSLPRDHHDNGSYKYLPTAPWDTVDMQHIGYQDPELANHRSKGHDCLIGCCNTDLEEPSSFPSQVEDDDYITEKPHGYLPLHHELDSGLGWTDGSLHQGDLSGLETEEGGLEDCHPHGGLALGGCGAAGYAAGGSPSSESFISSELSDSGFCSVSTGEFRRFQRLLEKRMRMYNARLHHQVEPCERRERRDSCPKSYRELLEAIPETLTVEPHRQHPQLGMGDGSGSAMGLSSRGLFRVSSVQFRKADRPSLNRHSTSSGALFNSAHNHTPMAPMGAPILSTCSTPSSHRRPLVAMQQQQHPGSCSVGMLRRSRTLHHRPPPQEYRRRASHPASPSYCTATLHHCEGVAPPRGLQLDLPEEEELSQGLLLSHPAHLAVSPQQHTTSMGHLRGALPHRQQCYDNNANHTNRLAQNDWMIPHEYHHITAPDMERDIEKELERVQKIQCEEECAKEEQMQAARMESDRQWELGRGREKEQPCTHGQGYPPQQGDINETWPKQASRQCQGSGGGRGLYSTLEGHIGTGSGAVSEQAAGNGQQNASPCSHPNPNPNPNPSPNLNPRVSRSQLLRDRASQLADERSGMSTDEETNTEMLRGRYWSRTERREQLLLAREQRQQQQQARAGGPTRDGGANGVRGMATAGGGVSATEGGVREGRIGDGGHLFAEGRCDTVLELSQRKLSRLRNRKLLDDWTTVEELLTHGTRLGSGEDMLCTSSLLTVTTV